MQRTSIVEVIKQAALDKIQQNYSELAYHNLGHTEFVLQEALKLAQDRGLSESETELLTLAAVAHDVIHDEDPLDNDYNAENEHASGTWLVNQMRQFEGAFTEKDLVRIPIIIDATYVKHREDELRQSALTGHQLSELLCDADLGALGSPWDVYFPKMKAIYDETMPKGKDEDWKEFLELQIVILLQHHYYTPEGQKRYSHLRENAEKVEEMLKEL
jgi:predicted metal-dependent HD superfamily phosphohydrolase